jgi:hypothetical protein
MATLIAAIFRRHQTLVEAFAEEVQGRIDRVLKSIGFPL